MSASVHECLRSTDLYGTVPARNARPKNVWPKQSLRFTLMQKPSLLRNSVPGAWQIATVHPDMVTPEHRSRKGQL